MKFSKWLYNRKIKEINESLKKIKTLEDRLAEIKDFCELHGYGIERIDCEQADTVKIIVKNEKEDISADVVFHVKEGAADIDFFEETLDEISSETEPLNAADEENAGIGEVGEIFGIQEDSLPTNKEEEIKMDEEESLIETDGKNESRKRIASEYLEKASMYRVCSLIESMFEAMTLNPSDKSYGYNKTVRPVVDDNNVDTNTNDGFERVEDDDSVDMDSEQDSELTDDDVKRLIKKSNAPQEIKDSAEDNPEIARAWLDARLNDDETVSRKINDSRW